MTTISFKFGGNYHEGHNICDTF